VRYPALGFVGNSAAILLSVTVGASAPAAVLQDARGRSVEVEGPVRRIASLSPSVTEILFLLGAGDAVVGVSQYCDYPVAAKLKPKVGEFNRPDLAALGAVAPDLVLFTEYVRPEDAEAMDRVGLRSAVLPAATLEDVAAEVEILGHLTGHAEDARRIASTLQQTVEEVKSRVEGIPLDRRPRVYVEVDGPHRPYAVGPGSFMDEVIRVAGGRNAFADAGAPYLEVTTAEVVKADPQVIFIDHPFQYKAGLGKREGWGGVAAVAGGRVYDRTDFDIILLNRPSPRIAESLREISRLLHPQVWNER